MIAAAALAAVLAAAQPAPDLALSPPAPVGPADARLAGGGPFAPRAMLGAGAGVLAGDVAFLGLAYGAYHLVTSHAVAPTLQNFRLLGIGLGLSALVLPPLGAALGAKLAGRPGGSAWRAFLLSMIGHAAALAVGYYAAPAYWAMVPVQLATMTAGASLGLSWGRDAPADRARGPRGEPEDRAARTVAVAWHRPVCPDDAAGR